MPPKPTTGKTKTVSAERTGSTKADPVRSARPARKSTKTTRGGAGKSSSSGVPKSVFLPLFTVWFLITIILAGLLYWSTSSEPPTSKPALNTRTSTATRNDPARSDRAREPRERPAQKETPQAHLAQPQPSQPPAKSAQTGSAPDKRAPRHDEQTVSLSRETSLASRETTSPVAGAPESPAPQKTSAAEVQPRKHDGGQNQVQKANGNPQTAENSSFPQQESRAWQEFPKPIAPKPAQDAPPSPAQEGRPANHTGQPSAKRIFEPEPPIKAKEIAREEISAQPPAPAPRPEQPRQENTSLALNATTGKPESPPPPEPPGPAPTAPLARVAIVIDDFGLDVQIAGKFADLPIPITFSILPYLKHSREIAQLAHERRREVLLHMPMEPKGYPKVNPGSGALLLSMSEDKIQKTLRDALDSNPYATGINNHMGSRFTENSQSMKVVLSELQHRGLYFLDSLTSPQSTGHTLARGFKMPTAHRDIFLDNSLTASSVRSQINQLIRKAKIEGTAIAIGHAHEVTCETLRREAGRFQKEGIAVVPLKELMSD